MSLSFLKDKRSDYFTYALLVFLISFFVLPTAKMVNNVYYIFLALPAIFYIFKSRFSAFRASYSVFLWLILLSAFTLSGFVHDADLQFYKHLVYVFLFLSVCVFFIRKDLFFSNNFYRMSFWIVSFYVLFSAVFYWVTGEYGFGERVIWLPARMTGPIYTSMLISALFSVSLPAWIKQGNYFEFFMGLVISLFCMAFILQSRTGIVSLIFVSFCFFIYFFYTRKGVVFVLLYSIPALILLGLVFAFSDSLPVVDQLVRRADSGRFELWQQVLKDYSECGFLLGCGPGFQSERLILESYPIVHPHNIFLALLVQTGIVSLALFLLICAWALYSSFLNKTYWGLYLLSSMVALNFDGSHIVGNPDELWVLILLPIFMIMLKDRNKKEFI